MILRIPITDEADPFATPVAVTTSKPKADITDVPKKDENSASAVSIAFIIVICLIAAAFVFAAIRRVRLERFIRKNNKKQ